MKLTKSANILILGIVLAVAVSACKKRPTPVTAIPGSRAGGVQTPPPGGPLAGTGRNVMDGAGAVGRNTSSDGGVPSRVVTPESIAKDGGIPQLGPGPHENWIANSEVLKEYTVHFDFDSSVVKSVDQGKVKAVADYLKANASNAVRVEGHCDERGTEEYNRALGERRAVAIREELVKMGIEPTRVDTISFGKDRPIDFGQNEEAWRKNRRGEFILLTPPTAAP